MRKRPVGRLLSLGIGHSIVSNMLLRLMSDQYIGHYTLIEGSDVLISKFRSRLDAGSEQLEIIPTFFEDYVPEEAFDAIEMGFVLEHVDDPGLILSRFKKFLRPGGTLFVAVPNARSLHRLVGNSAGLLSDLYELSDYDRQLGHQRYFDAHSIRALVEEFGFKVLGMHGLVLKPFSTQQLLDLSLPPEIWTAFTDVGYQLPEIANGIFLEATG